MPLQDSAGPPPPAGNAFRAPPPPPAAAAHQQLLAKQAQQRAFAIAQIQRHQAVAGRQPQQQLARAGTRPPRPVSPAAAMLRHYAHPQAASLPAGLPAGHAAEHAAAAQAASHAAAQAAASQAASQAASHAASQAAAVHASQAAAQRALGARGYAPASHYALSSAGVRAAPPYSLAVHHPHFPGGPPSLDAMALAGKPPSSGVPPVSPAPLAASPAPPDIVSFLPTSDDGGFAHAASTIPKSHTVAKRGLGECVQTLLTFNEEIRRGQLQNSLEGFWKPFVGRFFAPGGTVLLDATARGQRGKSLSLPVEVMPRIYKSKYDAGVQDERLLLADPCEFPQEDGTVVVDCPHATMLTRYRRSRVCTEGYLRVTFTPARKILVWEFSVSSHEELFPREELKGGPLPPPVVAPFGIPAANDLLLAIADGIGAVSKRARPRTQPPPASKREPGDATQTPAGAPDIVAQLTEASALFPDGKDTKQEEAISDFGLPSAPASLGLPPFAPDPPPASAPAILQQQLHTAQLEQMQRFSARIPTDAITPGQPPAGFPAGPPRAEPAAGLLGDADWGADELFGGGGAHTLADGGPHGLEVFTPGTPAAPNVFGADPSFPPPPPPVGVRGVGAGLGPSGEAALDAINVAVFDGLPGQTAHPADASKRAAGTPATKRRRASGPP